MRGLITFASLVLLAPIVGIGAAGCHRRAQGIFVADAHASSAQTGKQAELAAARAIAGDDEDDDSGTGHKPRGAGGGQGMNKWRDTGVYVDGRPVGVLAFGELPIGLKPVWKTEEHSIEFDYGYKGPRTRTSYERRYRVIDYLKAAGVDVAHIKEIHVMGPKLTSVLIASGKELRSKKGQELQFRFGGMVGGKAIPCVPENFGNGRHSDKIGAIMVYIKKKPPTLNDDDGLMLDGKEVDGIPYYGDPMRGGMRVYANDLLQAQIKRSSLKDLPGELGPDGKQRWKLWTVLERAGVDTSKIVEGWAIADERRKQKWTRAELEQLTLTLNERNDVVVDGKIAPQAIALHDHQLAPSELPQIRPDEDQD
jgi:hypothetical protein